MKPELSNYFTITTTGQNNDLVVSFYYEWRETDDGKTAELNKAKVASVVLSLSDVRQLMGIFEEVLTEHERSGEHA